MRQKLLTSFVVFSLTFVLFVGFGVLLDIWIDFTTLGEILVIGTFTALLVGCLSGFRYSYPEPERES